MRVYNKYRVMLSRNLTGPVIKIKWSGKSFHALIVLGKKELLNASVFPDMRLIHRVLFSCEGILFGSRNVVWAYG